MARRADAVLQTVRRAGAQRAEAALAAAALEISFETEHEHVALPIVAELSAAGDAVEIERAGARTERRVTPGVDEVHGRGRAAPAVAYIDAGVEAAPIVAGIRGHRRRLGGDVRHREISGKGARREQHGDRGRNQQSSCHQSSLGKRHCLIAGAQDARAIQCGDPREEPIGSRPAIECRSFGGSELAIAADCSRCRTDGGQAESKSPARGRALFVV